MRRREHCIVKLMEKGKGNATILPELCIFAECLKSDDYSLWSLQTSLYMKALLMSAICHCTLMSSSTFHSSHLDSTGLTSFQASYYPLLLTIIHFDLLLFTSSSFLSCLFQFLFFSFFCYFISWPCPIQHKVLLLLVIDLWLSTTRCLARYPRSTTLLFTCASIGPILILCASRHYHSRSRASRFGQIGWVWYCR